VKEPHDPTVTDRSRCRTVKSSRLASLTHDLSGTAYDVTKSFAYNPASQMTSVTTSNDAYASNVPDRGTTGFTTNGLNEFATIDGGAVSYDTNGNLAIDPWLNHSFSYNAEDQMTAASQLSATAGLSYDPLDRLDTYNPSSGAFRRFVYDGDEVSAELDSSGAIVNRYIRGDAPDEVLLHYSGSGSSSYRYYHLDERMSPIAWSDEAGAMAAISHYDEFGIPAATNPGRFQYTGQMWLSEIGEYFYKTRGFSANMGRFLQTDQTGYSAGANLYEYAGSDPVNFVDPLGLDKTVTKGCGTTGNCWPSLPPQPSAPGWQSVPTGTRIPGGLATQVFGGVGGSYGGGAISVCLQYCSNPPSGSIDASGAIVVYPSPVYGWVQVGEFAQINDNREFGSKLPLNDFQRWVASPIKQSIQHCASVIDTSQITKDAARGALFGATRGAVQGYLFGFLLKTLPPGEEAALLQGAIGAVTGGASGAIRGTAKSVSDQCSG